MRKIAALILLLVLVAMGIFPAATGAGSVSPTAKDILHPDLAALPDGADWDVLILLAEQTDTDTLADQGRNLAGPWVSGSLHRQLVRQQVVTRLQETARRTQAPAEKLLTAAPMKNEVVSWQSFYAVNALHVKGSETLVRALAALPEVAAVVPNDRIVLQIATTGDDTAVLSGDLLWNLNQVNAPAAWHQWHTRGEGIVVGIIDTGVDWQHPALKTAWRGYDPASPHEPNSVGNWYDAVHAHHTEPVDLSGHGTHVAGSVLGYDPGADYHVGVAPQARWIAANAFKQDDMGQWSASSSDLLTVGQYMLAPVDEAGIPRPDWAPDIINNSWGQNSTNEFFRTMVQNWRNAGILPVFAAGNTGPGTNSIHVPAGYPESLAVGMLDGNDIIANLSSRGPGIYSGITKPDLSAPGVSIRSCKPGGGYQFMTGTSMASPHVAGVAALVWSRHPGLTVDELVNALTGTALPLTGSYTTVPNAGYGRGRVDTVRALTGLAAGFWTADMAQGEATLTGGTGLGSHVTVPAAWEGWPVISLAPGVLQERGIDAMVLPVGLAAIGPQALAGNRLDHLELPETLSFLGERAVYGNRLSEIHVPATTHTIGPQALGGNQAHGPDLTIYGYAGSAAEDYALAYGHTFVPYVLATITLTPAPPAGGTVTGGGIYRAGEVVTAVAAPAEEYVFAGWHEGETQVSSDLEYIFSAEGDRDLTACFAPRIYTITTASDPDSWGAVQGSGSFPHGTTVTLTAQADTDYRFRYWQEGNHVFRDNPLEFTALYDRNLTAVFRSGIGARRLFGDTRYQTAVAISQEGWAEGAAVVVLARGDEFADALAGAPLAYALEAPVLITPPHGLGDAARTEIQRLGAHTVYILGGESAVAPAVAEELLQMGLTVVRLAGNNRYDTAARIARTLHDLGGAADTAVLAVGTRFPDALAAAAYAARSGMPILLTRTHTLPEETRDVLQDLSFARAVVVGGKLAISDDVVSQLPDGIEHVRISGPNRYETAAALAEYFAPDGDTVWLATGLDFPDAVTGGVLAAKMNGGLLLVDGTRSRPPACVEEILVRWETREAVLLGGVAAVCDLLEDWF